MRYDAVAIADELRGLADQIEDLDSNPTKFRFVGALAQILARADDETWLLISYDERVRYEQLADQIEAIGLLTTDSDTRKALTPQGLRHYWATHRQILDFAGVKPNPARDAAVKLPRILTDEPEPPISQHVIAVLDRIEDVKLRLPFVVMEQTAMTIGETEALTWGDVDLDGCSFRLRRSTVKSAGLSTTRRAEVRSRPWPNLRNTQIDPRLRRRSGVPPWR